MKSTRNRIFERTVRGFLRPEHTLLDAGCGMTAPVLRNLRGIEAGVLVAERWILARLRHETFFSLATLNARMAELLTDLNTRPMRLYRASRRELFERLDQPALRPLPAEPFVYGEWSVARVPPAEAGQTAGSGNEEEPERAHAAKEVAVGALAGPGFRHGDGLQLEAANQVVGEDAYEVRLALTGDLEWIERGEAGEIHHATEPGTTALQRAWVGFLSLLSIDWLL